MYSSDCHGSLHLMTSCCEIVTEDKLLQPGGGDFKLRDSPFLAKKYKKDFNGYTYSRVYTCT